MPQGKRVAAAGPRLFRADLIDRLGRHGDRPAVVWDEHRLSYAQLASRVAHLAARLGPRRRLVLVAARNDLGSLIAYLAGRAGGHAVLLAPADKADAVASLVSAYDPDVVVTAAGAEPEVRERRPGTRHDLHPELALLMSTSGSTGSPKLVRLSPDNLDSNAYAIAESLGIRPEDRALTTLPLHYVYGLSVVNSHLATGAALVLTELSVVDPRFWATFREHGATTFAAVPYTFELLERVGFAEMDLPTLRYVTQAGGRLAPEKVRRFAALGRERGWDLVVMYGQTEATARMATLDPALAISRAGTIGTPIPGGTFRIEPVEGLENGELVYEGPNVMLGYAEHPADLALGRTVHELRTGDLARRHDDGLFEVVGRRSRFVKIVGLRIDLGQVERILAEDGLVAAATGSDDAVVIAVEGDHDGDLIARVLAGALGLPRAAVVVHAVAELPLLPSGKPDYRAVLALGAGEPAAEPSPAAGAAGLGGGDVSAIFEEQFGVSPVPDGATFVSLGGDSLSYVAVSLRLEQALGRLPGDWHVTPVGRLATAGGRRRHPWWRFMAPVETTVVLRAAAIVMIVGTHVGVFVMQGAAHVLLAVAGFNFGRFLLGGERRERLGRQLRSVARFVVPSVVFIAVAAAVSPDFTYLNVLLVQHFVGPALWTPAQAFWFIEALTYLLLMVSALLAVPALDRLERRFPLALPLALLGAGLAVRYGLVPLPFLKVSPHFWAFSLGLFAFGWAVAKAPRLRQRLALAVVPVVTVPGFFQAQGRELLTIAGLLVLALAPSIPLPRPLLPVAGALAGASLHIYLTHWLVHGPVRESFGGPVAVLVSLAAGYAYWKLSSRVIAVVERGLGQVARRRRAPDPADVAAAGTPAPDAGPQVSAARAGRRPPREEGAPVRAR